MLRKPGYKQRWEKKLAWYRKQGILPIEESGRPHGILVITSDHPDGGIDVTEIREIIRKLFM